MRITTKGRVTIPAHIRKQAGFLPNTEVECVYDGSGQVRIFSVREKGEKTRGEMLVAHMRGKGDVKITTEEVIALTRGRSD